MKYAKIRTVTSSGLKLIVVDLEVTILKGLPRFEISGMSSHAGQEMFSRVRAALTNNGFQIPLGRIVCHLTKDINASNRSLDLALACAILLADKQVYNYKNHKWCVLGQLGLSGNVQNVNGVYAMRRSKELQTYKIIIPKVNEIELNHEKDKDLLNIFTAKDLNQAIDIITGKNLDKFAIVKYPIELETFDSQPLYQLIGQPLAKRALIIAMAGWHPLLLIGSPGSGKTTIAEYSINLLPALPQRHLNELRELYSLNGLWNENINSGKIRPYQAPHYTTTKMALIGGGSDLSPGIITMAHQGILFLDELSEFKAEILQLLRKPLTDQKIELARRNLKQVYPANFLLIAATNPCPCGYYLERDRRCKCKQSDIQRYKKRISGPLMDRFQLSVIMNDLPKQELIKTAQKDVIDKKDIKNLQRIIERAQTRQMTRCQKHKIVGQYNAIIETAKMAEYFSIPKECLEKFNVSINNFHFSPRSYLSLLRVSRTIADLEDSENVKLDHLQEALMLRVTQDKY